MSLPVEHVKLEDASYKQLMDFATIMMGLDVPASARSKDDVRAIIDAAGWPKETIPTLQKSSEIPAVSDADGNPRPRTFKHDFGGKGDEERDCVAISIPETDKPGGQEPVPVSVNGKQLWIPRNQRTVVPVEYVEVLENAEMFIYPPITAETSMQEMEMGLREPRVVKAYPFSYAA